MTLFLALFSIVFTCFRFISVFSRFLFSLYFFLFLPLFLLYLFFIMFILYYIFIYNFVYNSFLTWRCFELVSLSFLLALYLFLCIFCICFLYSSHLFPSFASFPFRPRFVFVIFPLHSRYPLLEQKLTRFHLRYLLKQYNGPNTFPASLEIYKIFTWAKGRIRVSINVQGSSFRVNRSIMISERSLFLL